MANASDPVEGVRHERRRNLASRHQTPIGTQLITLEVVDSGGETTGVASGRDDEETVPVRDIAFDGDRLTWKQSITKPMRLDLAFDVIVDGETLRGTAKAGRLPSSTVTGKRG